MLGWLAMVHLGLVISSISGSEPNVVASNDVGAVELTVNQKAKVDDYIVDFMSVKEITPSCRKLLWIKCREAFCYWRQHEEFLIYPATGYTHGVCASTKRCCLDGWAYLRGKPKPLHFTKRRERIDDKNYPVTWAWVFMIGTSGYLIGSMLVGYDRQIRKVLGNQFHRCQHDVFLKNIQQIPSFSGQNATSLEEINGLHAYMVAGGYAINGNGLSYLPNADAFFGLKEGIDNFTDQVEALHLSGYGLYANWPNVAWSNGTHTPIDIHDSLLSREASYETKFRCFDAPKGIAKATIDMTKGKEIACQFYRVKRGETVRYVRLGPSDLRPKLADRNVFYETVIEQTLQWINIDEALNFSYVEEEEVFQEMNRQIIAISEKRLSEEVLSHMKPIRRFANIYSFAIAMFPFLLVGYIPRHIKPCVGCRHSLQCFAQLRIIVVALTLCYLIELSPSGWEEAFILINKSKYIWQYLLGTSKSICYLQNSAELAWIAGLGRIEDLHEKMGLQLQRTLTLIAQDEAIASTYSPSGSGLYDALGNTTLYYKDLLTGHKFLAGFSYLPNKVVCDPSFGQVVTPHPPESSCGTVLDGGYASYSVQTVRDGYEFPLDGIAGSLIMYPAGPIIMSVFILMIMRFIASMATFGGGFIGSKAMGNLQQQKAIESRIRRDNIPLFIVIMVILIMRIASGIF